MYTVGEPISSGNPMKVGKNNMGQHAEVKIYEFMTKSQHCCQLLQKTNLVDREVSEQQQI